MLVVFHGERNLYKLMIDWKSPDPGLIEKYIRQRPPARLFASDTAPANIFLLAGKYDTKVCFSDGVLFRYYEGRNENRRGYGFPLYDDKSRISKALTAIASDAKERGVPAEFCLCDEKQMNIINGFCAAEWSSCDGDSDYIYKRESLSALSGKKLHRKRNHINAFSKLYDEYEYRAIDDGNSDDALKIARLWLAERADTAGADEEAELLSIEKALGYRRELGLFGGILYVRGEPAAMTLASAVSPYCADVHFEKAAGEYAKNGAFSVINRCFASSAAAAGFEYINREEDMGIEGLRTAKESYYPAYKIRKYYGRIKDIC